MFDVRCSAFGVRCGVAVKRAAMDSRILERATRRPHADARREAHASPGAARPRLSVLPEHASAWHARCEPVRPAWAIAAGPKDAGDAEDKNAHMHVRRPGTASRRARPETRGRASLSCARRGATHRVGRYLFLEGESRTGDAASEYGRLPGERCPPDAMSESGQRVSTRSTRRATGYSYRTKPATGTPSMPGSRNGVAWARTLRASAPDRSRTGDAESVCGRRARFRRREALPARAGSEGGERRTPPDAPS